MHPNTRFTHPISIATAAFVAALLLAAVILMLPAVSDASPVAKVKAAATAPKTGARITACTSAALYDSRRLEFSGRMESLDSADGGKLQMRFDVLRKFTESRRYRTVRAPGLGEWQGNTEPTATLFVRNIALTQIETRASYRARVRYRWLDAEGKVVRAKSRYTRVCKQTAPLPNPQHGGLIKFPNPGQPTTTYFVRVVNSSKSEARNVPVSLAIDGKPPVTKVIDSLVGKESVDVSFEGMEVCATETYVRIDPFNVVRESVEADNNARAAC